MYPSYETIAAQSGHYPFVEVYQFLSAGAYQFTGAGDKGAVRVGAPVYACKLQIIGCAKVGTIKSITNEEEHVQHPLFNSQIRGVLVELDLKDEQAAKNLTLFVGHSPFYVL